MGESSGLPWLTLWVADEGTQVCTGEVSRLGRTRTKIRFTDVLSALILHLTLHQYKDSG